MPILINKDEKVFGSIIYEEVGNASLTLNFFTTRLRTKEQTEIEPELPQKPMPQTWIVQYPLLAYKNFMPNNTEICIVHLAQNDMP